MTLETEIATLEEQLRVAMLGGDLGTLDALIG